MKHSLLAAGLLVGAALSAAAQQAAPPATCQSVRTGTFDILPLGAGSRITRTADRQVEQTENPDKPVAFKVKWLDDCTYELLPEASFFSFFPKLPPTAKLTVRITSVTDRGYWMEATSNFSSQVAKLEAVRVN